MKIILIKFVKGLGREGDIVDVSDGYAINSLFPRGLAKQATASVLNKYIMAKKSAQLKEEKERKVAVSDLEKINGKTIIFKEKLNSKGNLYHKISNKEIIFLINKEFNVKISEYFFSKKYSFKESGEYTIELEAYNKKIKMFVVIEGK